MKISSKMILKKISSFFFGLAALLLAASSYAGVSSGGGGDWIELFAFVIFGAGMSALLGCIFYFISKDNAKSIFANYLTVFASKLSRPIENQKNKIFVLMDKYRELSTFEKSKYLYIFYSIVVLIIQTIFFYCDWTVAVPVYLMLVVVIPLALYGIYNVVKNGKIPRYICSKPKGNVLAHTINNIVYFELKWDFSSWSKEKIMTIAPFYDIDKGRIVKACYFVDNHNIRTTVKFSDLIGELESGEIQMRKNELYVMRLSNSEYVLTIMDDCYKSDSLYEAFDF